MSKTRAAAVLGGVFLLGVVVGVLGAHVAALHAPHHLMEHVGSLDHETIFVDQLDRAVGLSADQRQVVTEVVRETHEEARELHHELAPRVEELLSRAGGRIEAVLEPEQVPAFRQFVHQHHDRHEHLLLGSGGGASMR